MGIVSVRRKRQRMQRIRRRMLVAALVALLGALAASQDLKAMIADAADQIASAQVFADAQSEQAELTLPEREIYALQLGVFDDGVRAASEAARLQGLGVRCIVWQREKMRIISSVALSRDALDMESAKGQDAYVIRETLSEIALRLEAGAGALGDVQALLRMPDSVLVRLLEGKEALAQIILETRTAAEAAVEAHPENELYTGLAQSLVSWCDLMDQMQSGETEKAARGYAAVTMCTLCRELRTALISS